MEVVEVFLACCFHFEGDYVFLFLLFFQDAVLSKVRNGRRRILSNEDESSFSYSQKNAGMNTAKLS